MAKAANLVSALRFALAGLWLAAYLGGASGAGIFGSIAMLAALSDLADGQIARKMNSVGPFGQWLDSLADITFVLTALCCEALAGAIPIYVPALIAASFAQYAIDSIVIGRSSTPIRSRIGHWGGVVNFALVIVLGFAPPPLWPGMVVRNVAPLLAIFYLAAIVERALSYRRAKVATPVRLGNA